MRKREQNSAGRFRRFLWESGLSIAAFLLFGLSIAGHALAGFATEKEEAIEHRQSPPTLGEYLSSGSFVESVFENWESEFLQMAVFVVATAFLHQKGSSESKPFEESAVDEDPKLSRDPASPWPVRRGGVALQIYEHSLSLTLFLLFVVSFILHAVGGAAAFSEQELRHGRHVVSVAEYLGTSRFWFESFQNWQSEFLSVGVLVLLSIVLRDRGSPQSKPVAASHAHTGDS